MDNVRSAIIRWKESGSSHNGTASNVAIYDYSIAIRRNYVFP